MTLSLLSMLAACATRPMLAACATAVLAVAATLPLSSAANSTLTVNTAVTPRQVSPDLWGVFFEELNHAGEGGLYSQEIQNTAFESKVNRSRPRRSTACSQKVAPHLIPARAHVCVLSVSCVVLWCSASPRGRASMRLA